MSDLQTQLRGYFDDVVERVSAQDVIAQVRVRQQPRFRGPVWAAATGAAAVTVGVGSVVVARWLLRGGPRLFRASHQATATTTATSWVLPVLIGIAVVLALGGLGVVALRRMRRGEGMETIERKTHIGTEPAKPNRWLVVTLAVLLVVAVVAIVWLLVAPSGPSLPADGQAMLDDNLAAWNAHDGDAVLANMGDGKHINGSSEYSGASLKNLVGSLPDGWAVEPSGELFIVATPMGKATLYLVMERDTIGNEADKTEGVSIFHMTHAADDSWRIVSHEWMQP